MRYAIAAMNDDVTMLESYTSANSECLAFDAIKGLINAVIDDAYDSDLTSISIRVEYIDLEDVTHTFEMDMVEPDYHRYKGIWVGEVDGSFIDDMSYWDEYLSGWL